MINYTKIFLRLALLSCLLILPSCCCLSIPLIFLISAGERYKDVSDDYERGHIVGKCYITLMDLTLYKYKDNTNEYYLGDNRYHDFYGNSPYQYEINVPAGTYIRVCKVFALTGFGKEHYRQRIQANFINENGEILRFQKCRRNPFGVSSLFMNTGQTPNENWYFECDPRYLKDVTDYEDAQELECNES